MLAYWSSRHSSCYGSHARTACTTLRTQATALGAQVLCQVECETADIAIAESWRAGELAGRCGHERASLRAPGLLHIPLAVLTTVVAVLTTRVRVVVIVIAIGRVRGMQAHMHTIRLSILTLTIWAP